MLLTILLAIQSLVINEVMQSNVDGMMDDCNEFPDSWVELHNASSSAIQLSNYAIGIGAAAEAWHLPSSSLAAGDYAIIYCDKEATGYHTDFRLPSDEAGAVRLYRSSTLIDELILPAQPAPNIAFGRAGNDPTQCGIMRSPTPGMANDTLAIGVLPTPVFSTRGYILRPYGRDSATLLLSLPHGVPDSTQIYYTLDGTEPTTASLRYLSPLDIRQTTIVRAKLFCPGYVSAPSHTESFIQPGRTLTLPVVAITTDPRYLYDNKIGIYVDGTYNRDKHNYYYDWRRPMNIEFFEVGNQPAGLNQLGEMRIQGAAMRANPIKSLAVYANKRFGANRLKYEFFPDQRPNEKRFKSLILRNAGNDFYGLYMRDAIIQRAMSRYVDIDWQAWRPAIVFFNGQYIGIQNIRERSNEDNIYSNYDKLEDIDMIENWYELKTGTWDEWNKFKTLYSEHGHTWQQYQQWLDCDEYINVMILNLFFDNTDFPGNNIVWWRPRKETAERPARWRILVKDTDFGLGLNHPSPNYNTIAWLNDNNYDSGNKWGNTYDATRLFRRAMEDSTFCRHFMQRAAIYIGDFLQYDRVWQETWQPMYERIRKEYPTHIYRFQARNDYDSQLNNAQYWLQKRPKYFLADLAYFYNWGSPVPMTIQMNDTTSNDSIRFNDVLLTQPSWNGRYYTNAAFTLQSNVAGWLITTTTSTGSTEQRIEGRVCTYTIPTNAKSVSIVAINHVDDLQSIPSPSSDCQKIWYNGHIYIHHHGCTYTTMGVPVSN